MIANTNHVNHVWEMNTHNSLVQLAGLSMRWPSFSSLNSSSTGIPGYGEPPSVKISHIKTPNDQLEETKTHSSDHFPSRTHSKHVPLVVHITLSISVLTVNTVRVYRHAIEMLNNQHFVQLFKGASSVVPSLHYPQNLDEERSVKWSQKSKFDPFTVAIFVGANNAVAVGV